MSRSNGHNRSIRSFVSHLPRIRTCPLGHTALHVMSTLRDGTLSESAARLVPGIAIRCCCVGTVMGFDAPAMFPSHGVMTWRPLLSTGSLGWFPRFSDTMGRSDSPPFVSTRSISSRADTTVSPVVCSPRSWASHRGPGSCRFRSPIRIDDGNVGVSQVPWKPWWSLSVLFDPGRIRQAEWTMSELPDTAPACVHDEGSRRLGFGCNYWVGITQPAL